MQGPGVLSAAKTIVTDQEIRTRLRRLESMLEPPGPFTIKFSPLPVPGGAGAGPPRATGYWGLTNADRATLPPPSVRPRWSHRRFNAHPIHLPRAHFPVP